MASKNTWSGFGFLPVVACAVMLASCSPKIYPSGLEGNLFDNQKGFRRVQFQRKMEAKKNDRQMAKMKREEQKPLKKSAKEEEMLRKKLYAEHFARQELHVQMRMKQNLKETEKKYPPRNTFWKKLVFWKKNSCPHGYR